MKWYDVFSTFYDSSLERLYYDSRIMAVEALDLKDKNVVMDVACGTGANFVHIANKGLDLELYGTDASSRMLEKARKLALKSEWDISIFESDARELDDNLLYTQFRATPSFDRIICFLGLSVIPDWESVLDNMLSLLKTGGRIVVADVFAETRTWNTWMVEKIARADLNRPIWQTLESKVSNFSIDYAPTKESKVGGRLFVASGVKGE